MIFINTIEDKNLIKYEDIIETFTKNPYNLEIKSEDNLYLVKYNDNSNIDNILVRESRGIILEKETNKLLCYPLNGKISYETFKDKYPDINEITVEESIDGTLINVYYNSEWNISTKGKINSDNSYWNSKKSFKSMFLEALELNNFNLNECNQELCYSFVLTHPENRIVTKYTNPNIYLVQIRNMNTYEILDKHFKDFQLFDTPKICTFTNYLEIEKSIENIDFQKEGYVLYSNDKKDRTKIKGKSYLKAKKLKGNNYCLEYRFLELIQRNRQDEYLFFFEEHKYIVSYFELHVNQLIDSLYYYYISTKIEKNFLEYPYHIKPLIYELHGLYIKKYKEWESGNIEKKPYVNSIIITDYIYNLPTKRLFYIINLQKGNTLLLLTSTELNI
jgi:hypothetical protein